MGRDKEFPLTMEMEANLTILLERTNKFQDMYGIQMVVSSGYRPDYYNTRVGGSKNSSHLVCQAIDFKDQFGFIKQFVMKDPSVLDKCDLYAEDFATTTTWIHLTIRPASKRIFKP